jgi:hypothetical protein
MPRDGNAARRVPIHMTPAGYMAKKVAQRPDLLKAPAVESVYSLSGCISEYFADYIKLWKHNGYWLFDSPDIIRALAREHAIPIDDCRIFYYEVFEQEFDEENIEWKPFAPERGCRTEVVPPARKRLEGYDVVTFAAGTSPECSPLSCNYLAATIATNRHCLFSSFDEAKARLEAGAFGESEPGPFRIFAVYSIDEA